MRMTITPERAKWLLEANTINRKVNTSSVDFLTRAITNGDWKYNGESIIVANDGTLLDGQHRLMACVSANKSIDVEFVDGVDINVMPTIDTGSARTSANVFEISGIQNYSHSATVVKNILDFMGRHRMLREDNRSYVKLSNTEILRFYNEHSETLNQVVNFAIHQYNTGVKILPPAQIATYMYLFSYEADSDVVVDFMRELFQGVRLRESNTASLLRTKLINEKIATAKMNRNTKIDFIIKAFREYKNNNSRQKLYIQDRQEFKVADVNIEPPLNFNYINQHTMAK